MQAITAKDAPLAEATVIKAVMAGLQAFADELSAAYLFGSYATARAAANSDIDVAVLLRTPPPRTIAGLRSDIADAIERHARTAVDLVVLNRAPPELVHRVLREGRLLCDLDPSHRVRFIVRARNEYFDIRRHLDTYRRLNPKRTR